MLQITASTILGPLRRIKLKHETETNFSQIGRSSNLQVGEPPTSNATGMQSRDPLCECCVLCSITLFDLVDSWTVTSRLADVRVDRLDPCKIPPHLARDHRDSDASILWKKSLEQDRDRSNLSWARKADHAKPQTRPY